MQLCINFIDIESIFSYILQETKILFHNRLTINCQRRIMQLLIRQGRRKLAAYGVLVFFCIKLNLLGVFNYGKFTGAFRQYGIQ